jgi:hypothetical protein
MTLKDLIAADVAIFFNEDEFSRSVIYRATSGVETTLTANVYESESISETNNGINTITRTQAIQFPSTYTQIDSTGVFILDDVEWAVTPEISTDGTLTVVMCKRFELHEQARTNYRRV